MIDVHSSASVRNSGHHTGSYTKQCCISGFAEVWNPQFSLEGFQKMALSITEQWVRERVKLNHDNLGMISFVILRLLLKFTIFPW